MLDETRQKLGTAWCNLMHDSAMWPIHGEYECWVCGRRYPVAWANGCLAIPLDTVAPAQLAIPSRPRLRQALLPLVVFLAICLPSVLQGADERLAGDLPGASLAFARYITGLGRANTWATEDVEIDAWLPRLAKQGRLHAIRRTTALGEAEYQVLELAGDPTVRRQVISRYLSAETTAAAMPSTAVALTPANYDFRYKGIVKTGTEVAYVFQIKPRKKREGLIRGELWLEAETGVAVRLSGYMVRSPSIFVKRVDVTREVTLQRGLPVVRVTHLSVDTRLVGLAQLTIKEAPYSSPDVGSTMSSSSLPASNATARHLPVSRHWNLAIDGSFCE
jgi:hypothetical protein